MAILPCPDSKSAFRPKLFVAFASAIILFCSLFITSLSAQTNGPSKPESEVIRGTVVNSQTHEPIGHALVYSPDNRFATMTDDRGHFQFNLAQFESQTSSTGVVRNPFANRPYALVARKPGFLPPGNHQPIPVTGETQSDFTISLVPEALIVGRVLIPGADGFDRIQVELFRRTIQEGAERWQSAGTVLSRSNGEFRFAELQPGSYKLLTHELLDRDPLSFNPRGQLFGYPPVYYPSGTDLEAASVIQLTPGTTLVANISPVRREYYPVKMKLANAAANLPIDIQVWPQGHPGPGYALGYNPTEGLIQGSLPDGFYVVQVSSYGPNAMSGTSNLLVKGAAAEGQTVILLPNISIPVTVHEEFQLQETLAQIPASEDNLRAKGRPRYLQVNLLPVENFGPVGGASMRQPQNPQDDSPLVIENVHPGRYRVQVNTPFGFASSIISGGINLLSLPLVVPAGGAISPVEITLRDDGAEVEGAVENANSPGSSQQSQGQVYFVPVAGNDGQPRIAWLSPEGKFQLRQLPPGEYRVLAFNHPQPELEYESAEAMRKYDSKAQILRVTPGQKAHLRLQFITADD
jgi:hypothetical protein